MGSLNRRSFSHITNSSLDKVAVTKIVLGLWVKKQGVKANSESLINSGADALLDAVISVTTLAAAGSVSRIGAHRHSGYHDRRGNRPASAGYCR